MVDTMLSTSDNPFSPFTEWDQWYAWDFNAGHHTPGLLARVIITSDELSELDQAQAYDDAVNEIISEDPLGIYVKVSAPS